jgi:pyruvate formate lyase activating enzyme
MRLPVHGWVRTSLLDYPGHICSCLFLAGCNFRCPYCHNPDLVLVPDNGPSPFSPEEIFGYFERYRGLLEGICLSGGEPLLARSILEFLREVRSLGLKIKVDTNGSLPRMLRRLLEEELVDYVAMDIKGPLEKIASIARSDMAEERLRAALEESVRLLKGGTVAYEFRTTVVPGLLDEGDFEAIGEWLEGGTRFVLQQFRPGRTLDPAYSSLAPFPPDYLEHIARRMKKFVGACSIRGIG